MGKRPPALDAAIMTATVRHGEVRDQRQLHALLRALADTRGISRRTLDDLAGLSETHSERILSELPEKRIGIDTMFKLMRGLGIVIVLEDCPKALAQITEYLSGRANHMVRAHVGSIRVKTREQLKKVAIRIVKKDRRNWSIEANQARNSKLAPKQRSDIARHAARVRHSRERKARKLAKLGAQVAPMVSGSAAQ